MREGEETRKGERGRIGNTETEKERGPWTDRQTKEQKDALCGNLGHVLVFLFFERLQDLLHVVLYERRSKEIHYDT